METLLEVQKRFTDQLQSVDDVAQVVLKGHLVMEELMTEAIGEFLLHKSYIESAKLQFHQKLQLCRAISISDNDNSMWSLVASINSLRNHMSHSLNMDERARRVEALNAIYSKEFPNSMPEDFGDTPRDVAICMYAISGALGYLHAHFQETRRLKFHVSLVVRGMREGPL